MIDLLYPKWRRAVVQPFGEVEVRSPTVADAARYPKPGWWRNCIRGLDGKPLVPEDADFLGMDAAIVNRILDALAVEDRPTSPGSEGSPG